MAGDQVILTKQRPSPSPTSKPQLPKSQIKKTGKGYLASRQSIKSYHIISNLKTFIYYPNKVLKSINLKGIKAELKRCDTLCIFSRQHLYQNPGSLGSAEQRAPRDRSLPPRVWSAVRNQVMLMRCKENRKEGETVPSTKHVVRLLNVFNCRKLLILNGRELLRITSAAEGGTQDQPSGITDILKSHQGHRLQLQVLRIQKLVMRNVPRMVCSVPFPRPNLLRIPETQPASALFPQPTLLLSQAAQR